ncbi:MAG: hypothetical protein U5L04_11540 [Trueperaceae bacterium]|nr:hypothetical protein [Trueperaceae bacterium]
MHRAAQRRVLDLQGDGLLEHRQDGRQLFAQQQLDLQGHLVAQRPAEVAVLLGAAVPPALDLHAGGAGRERRGQRVGEVLVGQRLGDAAVGQGMATQLGLGAVQRPVQRLLEHHPEVQPPRQLAGAVGEVLHRGLVGQQQRQLGLGRVVGLRGPDAEQVGQVGAEHLGQHVQARDDRALVGRALVVGLEVDPAGPEPCDVPGELVADGTPVVGPRPRDCVPGARPVVAEGQPHAPPGGRSRALDANRGGC